jgi:LysM repeat protein
MSKKGFPAYSDEKCNMEIRDVYRFNHIKFIIAKDCDTFYKIAHDFKIELDDLLSYNDFSKSDKLIYGQKIYLEKKRRKALEPYHVVQKNETLKSISQLHGIRLSMLCKKNKLKPDDKLKVGDVLFLRQKKTQS